MKSAIQNKSDKANTFTSIIYGNKYFILIDSLRECRDSTLLFREIFFSEFRTQ